MHRAKALDLLQKYNPTEIDEIKFKKDIILFIKQNNHCFERTHKVGHITSSAWVLNKDRNQAILTHHAKLGDWYQLGGHCDGDPDILQVALKEAKEESGILNIEPIMNEIFDIDIHPIPKNSKEEAHYHYDIRFLLQVKSDEDLQINRESKELLWVTQNLNDLPTSKRSVTRMFDKWINFY